MLLFYPLARKSKQLMCMWQPAGTRLKRSGSGKNISTMENSNSPLVPAPLDPRIKLRLSNTFAVILVFESNTAELHLSRN